VIFLNVLIIFRPIKKSLKHFEIFHVSLNVT
jgi:hypothetical protein